MGHVPAFLFRARALKVVPPEQTQSWLNIIVFLVKRGASETKKVQYEFAFLLLGPSCSGKLAIRLCKIL